MNHIHAALKKRADGISQDLDRDYSDGFHVLKKDVIDFAFKQLKIDSVAELGCVWGVDGAYGRYIADKHKPSKITMVDLIWNDEALKLCGEHEAITTVEGNFGDLTMPKQVGKVDAVIFFDILLHMVAPDWNSVLKMYAEYTSTFLIVNPQFFGAPTTTRLVDLDQDEYFLNCTHARDESPYDKVFADPHKYDPKQKKSLRDAFYIWQWGITNHDLIDTMEQLGFSPIYLKKGDIYYGEAKNFLTYGFIFTRDPS